MRLTVDESKTRRATSRSNGRTKESDLLTFQDHIQELRNRLFWVAVVFIIASAAAYPFFDIILSVLVRPLGDQQLHYLTPVGGFSFILKVCMYAGILAAIPVIIYQLFRYVQPVMGHVKRYTLLVYIAASVALAATGITLAYFISLPAALNFLTGFELPQITAMLTADSYFSFIMTYLLAAAILFQLPLILLIINNITPLNPGTMMKQQRYVIVVAFVLGAVISPTPDALNQLLMSGPIIVMYQIGIILVMARNYFRKKQTIEESANNPVQLKEPAMARQQPILQPAPVPVPVAPPQPIHSPPSRPAAFDVVASPRSSLEKRVVASARPPAPLRPPERPSAQYQQGRRSAYRRSIDGFAMDA